MSKKLKITVTLLSIFGLFIILYCSRNISNLDIWNLVYWIFLTSLFESLPIFYAKDRAVSVSFAVLLASQLSNGVYLTTLIGAFGCALVFIRNADGTYKHLFNIPLYKTLINSTNFTISLFTAGMLYEYLHSYYPLFSYPVMSILLVILYTVTVFLLNSTIMTFYASLMTGNSFLKMWISGTLWAFPNFIAIAPIGFFLHLLYRQPSGSLYILMLLGPLLLARYSFKLYLDSKDQYYMIIKTLSAAIEAKDEYTDGHSRRVEHYAEQIAQKLRFSPSLVEAIKVAALLHDIGKIGIKDSTLNKPGNLTDEEWEKVKQHPSIGMKILEGVSFPKRIKDAILHHHERYDGTGYPNNLKGDQISIDAYILAAADAYDAMTSDRPYRKAIPKKTAIDIIRKARGKQFHPDIADILISILEQEDLVPESNPQVKEAEANNAI
jgi:putative nucleotidyltransferase with HDIG domain